MTTPEQENARTLSVLLGVSDAEAVELLDASVLITANKEGALLAQDIYGILGHTLKNVALELGVPPRLEIVVGNATPRTSAPVLGVAAWDDRFEVREGCAPVVASDRPRHRIIDRLAACYASAVAVQRSVQANFPVHVRLPLVFDLRSHLGVDAACLRRRTSIGEAYLAGAGAIGNAVLYGLSCFDVHGVIHLCDPDSVSNGNLNRCVYFAAGDVGKKKAAVLANAAQDGVPGLRLIPELVRLQDVEAAKKGGPWLEKLIVAVDSRRARRELQNQMPRCVFDASTSELTECVLHANRSPSEFACMSCIYHEDPDEAGHEKHVATQLGLDLDEVHANFITKAAASKIVGRYPQLRIEDVEGEACDSLFKQLCGQGALKLAENRQVLAPLAFLSVVGGLFLAIEIIRRAQRSDVEQPFNYWRVGPWAAPSIRGAELRRRQSNCTHCGKTIFRELADHLWGNENPRGIAATGGAT